jgi:hypothetical protein
MNASKLNFNNFPLFEFKIKSANSINFQIGRLIIRIIKLIIILISKIQPSLQRRTALLTNAKKVAKTNKIPLHRSPYRPVPNFKPKLLIGGQREHKGRIGRIFNISTHLEVVFGVEMQRGVATDDFVLFC